MSVQPVLGGVVPTDDRSLSDLSPAQGNEVPPSQEGARVLFWREFQKLVIRQCELLRK